MARKTRRRRSLVPERPSRTGTPAVHRGASPELDAELELAYSPPPEAPPPPEPLAPIEPVDDDLPREPTSPGMEVPLPGNLPATLEPPTPPVTEPETAPDAEPEAPAPEAHEPETPPDAPTARESSPPDTSHAAPLAPLPHDLPLKRRWEMGRGHLPEPEPEPLLTELEKQVALGLAALASGFILTGAGGLFGLWLVLGARMTEALFGP